MRFVDQANITVSSGKGGNGCASFRRERFIPKGGPNGGDGGKGGDVILRASATLLTLYDFRLKRHYEAKNGQPGMGKDRYGKAADDLVIDLPIGTLVYEILSDEETGETSETLVADLVQQGAEKVICLGGRGGRGNLHFKSATNRAPRFAEEGKAGQTRQLRLELKILADVGLLGLPNAGKSTFIAAVSAAKPKIAAYPFTTLVPNLGVIEREAWQRMVIADIPGLIEGASKGLGLGHTFLRHVERTRFLLHILSAEELRPQEDNPFYGYELLNEELHYFDPRLSEKKQILVVNKIDLLEPEQFNILQKKAQEQSLDIQFISALTGQGLESLLTKLWAVFLSLDEEE